MKAKGGERHSGDWLLLLLLLQSVLRMPVAASRFVCHSTSTNVTVPMEAVTARMHSCTYRSAAAE